MPEQADIELAGGDIVIRDGVLMDTKDSLLPEDDIIDQGYIAIKYTTGSARKCVYIPEEGAYARLEGEVERNPVHWVRDGKDWRMTVEKPAGLANDIEVKLAEVRGRQAGMQQEQRNSLRHSIQLHTPKDPAYWVCQKADVASSSKGNLPVGEPETGLSLGMDMAVPLPESLDGKQCSGC